MLGRGGKKTFCWGVVPRWDPTDNHCNIIKESAWGGKGRRPVREKKEKGKKKVIGSKNCGLRRGKTSESLRDVGDSERDISQT